MWLFKKEKGNNAFYVGSFSIRLVVFVSMPEKDPIWFVYVAKVLNWALLDVASDKVWSHMTVFICTWMAGLTVKN